MMLPGPRKGGERKVHGDGLHALGRRGYLAEGLARPDVFHHDVRVRVFHHRVDKLAVFKPLPRRADPDAAEFVCFAEDCSTVDKAKRTQLMRIWQVGMETIERAADTATRLKETSAIIGTPGESLTEAVFALADQADAATEPTPEPRSAKVDPGRRPATTHRAKQSRRGGSPSTSEHVRADAEFGAIEDAIDLSLRRNAEEGGPQ